MSSTPMPRLRLGKIQQPRHHRASYGCRNPLALLCRAISPAAHVQSLDAHLHDRSERRTCTLHTVRARARASPSRKYSTHTNTKWVETTREWPITQNRWILANEEFLG